MKIKPGLVVEIEDEFYKIVTLDGPDLYTSRFNCLVERIPHEK